MILILALILSISPACANERIDKLKNYLGQRDRLARIYMPQQITEGESVDVLVQAPGAESVTILGSRSNTGYASSLALQLGADAIELAKAKLDAVGRAGLTLAIPLKPVVPEPVPEKKAKKVKGEKKVKVKIEPDIYYIEALITYPDGLEVKALNFGANAIYVGYNGMRVVPPVKDNAGAAQMARSFVPGMAGLPVGSY